MACLLGELLGFLEGVGAGLDADAVVHHDARVVEPDVDRFAGEPLFALRDDRFVLEQHMRVEARVGRLPHTMTMSSLVIFTLPVQATRWTSFVRSKKMIMRSALSVNSGSFTFTWPSKSAM